MLQYVHVYKQYMVQYNNLHKHIHSIKLCTPAEHAMVNALPLLESTPFFPSQGVNMICILLPPSLQLLLHALNVLLQRISTRTHWTQVVHQYSTQQTNVCKHRETCAMGDNYNGCHTRTDTHAYSLQ